MEVEEKKHAIFLGIRVSTISLVVMIAVGVLSFYVLSNNFQVLLTEHTISMIESMNSQGVDLVESEIARRKQLISSAASSFVENNYDIEKSQLDIDEEYVRLVYTTVEQAILSNGKEHNLYNCEDIKEAFLGSISMYGPYFNEENEYIVRFSAPVKQNQEVLGVLSIEFDGYLFCDLIQRIRIVESGESYIINAEGTDIAVSNKEHIDWVNSQYNARKLLESEKDEETKSILDLEQKGLDGETGIGTYYWEDGLCYLAYEPIPSLNWVLLSGIREEELSAMIKEIIFYSVVNGPVLKLSLIMVILLLGLIFYWIFSSKKKDANINEKLKKIANYDTITGLMNRHCYHNDLNLFSKDKYESFTIIYIDVNGLHEINNHLGHQAGDQMLIAVAEALKLMFSDDYLYRIGGDEFVVLCLNKNKEEVDTKIVELRTILQAQNYEISIGVAYQENDENFSSVEKRAETNMQVDKQHYYERNNKDRRMRGINKQLEKMISDKQDADTFLSVIAPEFNGVYFVNLSEDSIRHLFIPNYFEECLKEANDRFSVALIIYAKKIVKPEYYDYFVEVGNYTKLKEQLDNPPEYIFQKKSGEWLKMKILKFRDYTEENQNTLWIFSNIDKPN